MRVTGYRRISRHSWLGLLALGAACAVGAVTAPPASAMAVRAAQCQPESFSWSGLGDGTSWKDRSNWEPHNRFPGICTGDSVNIAIEALITGAPAVTLKNLTIAPTAGSDGSLTGGPLTVTGSFVWDGGYLGTTINIPTGATGVIGGPQNEKDLGTEGVGLPGKINVSGSLTLADLAGSNGSLLMGSGSADAGVITVATGGTLTGFGENDLVGASCCIGPGLPTLVNNGTISVTSGRIFTNGVVFRQAGHADVAAGALLDASGPTQLEKSSSYTGAGEMLLDIAASPTRLTGTISLGAGFHLDLGPQACLDGTGTITGPGSLDFTGGYLAAALTIAHGAFMHVTGPDEKDLANFSCGIANGVVTNNGTIVVDQGLLSLGASGTITTSKGATFAVAPGATVGTDTCCPATRLLVTKGTFQVTAPPAGVTSGTPATLDFAPWDNSGTVSVAKGQKLAVTGAPTIFETGTSLTGPGSTTVIQAPVSTGATVTLGPKTTVDLGQNGSLDGITSIGGSGTLRWTGGAVSGTVGVASTIPVKISGAAAASVVDRPNGNPSVLTTHGPVSIAAGTAKAPDTVQVGQGDQWVSAGTLRVPKHASIGAPVCCGPTPGLENTGTMTVATGGGRDEVTTPVLNAGTVKLASGVLALTAGSYQQAASGTLAITFSGTSPGKGFGQLDASAVPVTLAGKLLIGTGGGFKPPHGQPFAVLRYTSRSGKFGKLSGSPGYTVAYHATGMDVIFR